MGVGAVGRECEAGEVRSELGELGGLGGRGLRQMYLVVGDVERSA